MRRTSGPGPLDTRPIQARARVVVNENERPVGARRKTLWVRRSDLPAHGPTPFLKPPGPRGNVVLGGSTVLTDNAKSAGRRQSGGKAAPNPQVSYGGQTRDESRIEVKFEPSRAEDRSGLNRARVILLAEASVLAAGLVVAALSSRASDWQPVYLVALLLVLAIGSEAMTIELRRVRMSGSFLALVLAMALLGPAPAAAIGCVSVLADDVARRRPLRAMRRNAMTFVVFPLARALLIRLATEGAAFGEADALGFAALVGVVAKVMNENSFG